MIPVDLVYDYETVGPAPNGAVVELSYTPFLDQPDNVPTFEELVNKSRKYKFNVRKQIPKRISDKGTIEWWKKQDPEAQKILKALPDDLDLYDGMNQFFADLKADGVDRWQSFDYCRGPEFDRAILIDIVRQMHGKLDVFNEMPTVFWNSRDVRTAIENRLMVRGMTYTPLRRGILNGFIKHDSRHDCAKDVLMLIYAKRYAFGLEDAPEGDDIDPLSLPDKK